MKIQVLYVLLKLATETIQCLTFMALSDAGGSGLKARIPQRCTYFRSVVGILVTADDIGSYNSEVIHTRQTPCRILSLVFYFIKSRYIGNRNKEK